MIHTKIFWLTPKKNLTYAKKNETTWFFRPMNCSHVKLGPSQLTYRRIHTTHITTQPTWFSTLKFIDISENGFNVLIVFYLSKFSKSFIWINKGSNFRFSCQSKSFWFFWKNGVTGWSKYKEISNLAEVYWRYLKIGFS